MQKFDKLEGVAAPMDIINIDTDNSPISDTPQLLLVDCGDLDWPEPLPACLTIIDPVSWLYIRHTGIQSLLECLLDNSIVFTLNKDLPG